MSASASNFDERANALVLKYIVPAGGGGRDVGPVLDGEDVAVGVDPLVPDVPAAAAAATAATLIGEKRGL